MNAVAYLGLSVVTFAAMGCFDASSHDAAPHADSGVSGHGGSTMDASQHPESDAAFDAAFDATHDGSAVDAAPVDATTPNARELTLAEVLAARCVATDVCSSGTGCLVYDGRAGEDAGYAAIDAISCIDLEETRTFPGPCSAEERTFSRSSDFSAIGEYSLDMCDYAYEDERLTVIDYTAIDDVQDGWEGRGDYTYAIDGSLVRYDYYETDYLSFCTGGSFSFGADEVIWETAVPFLFNCSVWEDARPIAGMVMNSRRVSARAGLAWLAQPSCGADIVPTPISRLLSTARADQGGPWTETSCMRTDTGGGRYVDTCAPIANQPSVQQEVAYDAEGRVIELDGLRVSYDGDGRVEALDYPPIQITGPAAPGLKGDCYVRNYRDRGGNLVYVTRDCLDRVAVLVYDYGCWRP